jgi:hypothetical protein
VCLSLNSTSTPISYQTFSNAAYTAYRGDFQVIIEPKDIGEITVFSTSARLADLGLGFSNMHEGIERRNWGSVAFHLRKIPLAFGFNGGIIKIYDQTDPLFDLGAWYHGPVCLGMSFSNILNDDKLLRGGIAYTWRQITASIEVEDSIRSQEMIPHGIVALKQPVNDFKFCLYGGFRPGQLSGAVAIEFRNFIQAMVLYEDSVRVLIGFNFRPPVIEKEVTIIDTLLVDKPIIVEKTVIKKPPQPTPEKPLSKEELDYCEKHYLKGIGYYVNDDLEMAIEEWNLVVKVYPKYKDVQRYLGNAEAKRDLLKE